MRHYFVTGLPGSGTTWVANFLTHGQNFCYHDGLMGCVGMNAYREKMNSGIAEVVGDSDSGLLLYLDRLKQFFPDAPLVVILRDPLDCIQSMTRRGIYPGEKHMAALLKSVGHAAAMADLIIPFNGLFGEATMRGLWDKLSLVGAFPHDRWEMLSRIKVEPDMPKYLAMWEEQKPFTMTAEAA